MILNKVSKAGLLALQGKQAVIIGLSIRNNYFRGNNIEQITHWAKNNFGQLVFMLPDEPSVHTLSGLGYSLSKSRQKAMLACNNLENKCLKTITKFDLGTKSQIVRWAQLNSNQIYNKTYSTLSQLYKNDKSFRADTREATRHVMENHKTILPLSEAIDLSIPFLIKELSFIIAAVEILELNCPVAYLYHRHMPILDFLLLGKYQFIPSDNNGYIVAELEPHNSQKRAIKVGS